MFFMTRFALHSQFVIILMLMLALQGCFGTIDKRGSVRGYDDGVVKTVGGQFLVTPLSKDWEKKQVGRRALLFQNRNDQATITISSWCKRAFDDGSPKSLSEQLYYGLDKFKVVDEAEVPLGGRMGYVMEARGELDSAPIHLKSYVVKMNECVFDFLYVTSPERKTSVGDFDRMVSGFKYVKGPGVL